MGALNFEDMIQIIDNDDPKCGNPEPQLKEEGLSCQPQDFNTEEYLARIPNPFLEPVDLKSITFKEEQEPSNTEEKNHFLDEVRIRKDSLDNLGFFNSDNEPANLFKTKITLEPIGNGDLGGYSTYHSNNQKFTEAEQYEF
jgi:hypothetical protein